MGGITGQSVDERDYQVAEKVIYRRLLKNGQMQGPRNHEE